MKPWSAYAFTWVAVGAVASAAGCKARRAAGETHTENASVPETLTIGGLMPLSGPVSTVGQAWTRGWEVYWDKVNGEGGVAVGGKKVRVKFVAADSKFDAEAAAESAKKLIYKDGATFVFGEITNAAAVAIESIAAKEGVLTVVPWVAMPGGSGDVSPQRALVIRPFISASDSWSMDWDYLRQEWPTANRLAIVGWLGNEPMLKRVSEEAKKSGFEVVGTEAVSPDGQDFMPVLTKIIAAKPEAIQLATQAIAGYLVRAIRQAGFTGPVFSDSPLDPQVIKDTAGEAAADNVFCNGMDAASATPEMQDVVHRWTSRYHEPFVSDAWLAWDTAWIVHQAMTRADSVDPPRVAAAFETMNHLGDIKTVFGPGKTGGKNTLGVDRVVLEPIPISRIDHGQIRLVKLSLPSKL